ncbi:MAG: exodeoxyribonuclease V subunit alpha [Pseudomonadales bacterium]|nr:exodeoxyribonuclease V subunit alpha [Pseudomonadales bacterium]
MSSLIPLRQRFLQGELLDIDYHFATLLAKLTNTNDAQLLDVFAELSQAQHNQHSCIDITHRPELQGKLLALDCVTETSSITQAHTPLVLTRHKDGNCLLYLQRYHQYEVNLLEQLLKRNRVIDSNFTNYTLLDTLFKPSKTVDWQKVAAFQALHQQLTIITGGPGTGKTSTVVKILAALIHHYPQLRVKLAAPTGKAAARLNESIKSALTTIPEDLRPLIPTDVTTLHRLLGMRADGRSFRFNRNNHIAADLVIIDEVSMIDLAMFNRLVDVLPDQTRLILLGDPGQLPSVENGAVLTHLSQLGVSYDAHFKQRIKTQLGIKLESAATQEHGLTNAFCHLQKSYRFADDTGIGALAQNIRARVTIDDWTTMNNIRLVEHYDQTSVIKDLRHQYQPYLDLCRAQQPAATLFKAFDACRALSPLRAGDFGVNALNAGLETALQPASGTNPLYHGKPIIINQNDYNLQLFNGDVGLMVIIDGVLKVAFRAADATIKYHPVARLPGFETCFIMTVHKSQGSEFDHISLVLPGLSEGLEDLITNELIYTAITRAKKTLTIYANLNNLSLALRRKTNRLGGLEQLCRAQTYNSPASF